MNFVASTPLAFFGSSEGTTLTSNVVPPRFINGGVLPC